MKKVLAIAAAALLALGAFAQEVSFENDLFTDTVKIKNDGVSFPGIGDEVIVDFTSDRVDFGVDATSAYFLSQSTFSLVDWDFDWYVEFRPVQMLTLGFHDPVFTTGSYLPVEDDNIATGNFATENGFALIVRPVNGLRIGTGLDFGYDLAGDNKQNPDISFGFDYMVSSNDSDLVAFGASVRDVANDSRSAGAYVSFVGLEGAEINLGYTWNDADGMEDVAGTNLVSLGATYAEGAFSCKFDFVTDFAGSGYDMYAGLLAGYKFADNFGADFRFRAWADFNNETSTTIDFRPRAKFFIGEEQGLYIATNVALTFADSLAYTVKFPIVYWIAF